MRSIVHAAEQLPPNLQKFSQWMRTNSGTFPVKKEILLFPSSCLESQLVVQLAVPISLARFRPVPPCSLIEQAFAVFSPVSRDSECSGSVVQVGDCSCRCTACVIQGPAQTGRRNPHTRTPMKAASVSDAAACRLRRSCDDEQRPWILRRRRTVQRSYHRTVDARGNS